MTDRAELERQMAAPISRTNWMHDDPCPVCDGMTLATNGTGSRWCIDRNCGYAVMVTRARPVGEVDRKP